MRTRTAAGLLAVSLLGMPLLAACSDDASIEVSRRDDDDDTRPPRTDEPPDTEPPDTEPPDTEPPDTDPPDTEPPTRPTLSVPPPPTPAPPTSAPNSVPPETTPPTAAPPSDPTTPSGTGSLPPVDQLVALVPPQPPGAIDFDKSTEACDLEGLCLLTLVVNNSDYSAVAAYYETEFPNFGVALDAVSNDGQLWSANMTAPGVTGFTFIEASTDFPGFTDVLISFFPA